MMFRWDEYFVYILLSIRILLVVDKVHIAVVGDASYTVTDTVPLQTLAWDAALIKAFTSQLNRSPMTHHICSTVVRHITVP